MPSVDAEIDLLYQLPLAEFTAARNTLAKHLGKAGAPIKTLQKPGVAAWAVNQLYWRRREVYDRLLLATEGRRAAHARRLAGKGGDIDAAERAHRDAIKAALGAIRELLRDAGAPATPATMTATTDTLQALPGSEPPGRLTGGLKPLGLEALAGLVPRAAHTLTERSPAGPRRTAATPSARVSTTARDKQAAAEARRAEQALRREVSAVEREILKARKQEQQAEKALKVARQELGRAERAHDRLRDQVQFALKQIQDSRDEVAGRDVKLREAANARAQLQARLDSLLS